MAVSRRGPEVHELDVERGVVEEVQPKVEVAMVTVPASRRVRCVVAPLGGSTRGGARRGRGITANDVVDALGDGREDPVDDTGVDPAPLTIAVVVGRDGGDVGLQPKLAEGGLEEVAPLAEVALIHV
jgi:hypothetical protein